MRLWEPRGVCGFLGGSICPTPTLHNGCLRGTGQRTRESLPVPTSSENDTPAILSATQADVRLLMAAFQPDATDRKPGASSPTFAIDTSEKIMKNMNDQRLRNADYAT